MALTLANKNVIRLKIENYVKTIESFCYRKKNENATFPSLRARNDRRDTHSEWRRCQRCECSWGYSIDMGCPKW